MSGNAGGGSSGSYTTPGYMSQLHCMMLLGINPYVYKSSKKIGFDQDEFEARDPLNLYDAIRNVAQGDSPYANEVAYNPGTLVSAGSGEDSGDELYRVQARIEDLRAQFFTSTDINNPTSGTVKDPDDIWLALVDSAENSAMIDTLVDDFETKTLPQHARAVNRLVSGFAAMEALDSSACTIAKAMLEAERVRGMAELRSNLVNDSAVKMLAIWQFMGQMMQNLIAAQLNASQMSIVSKIDQWRTNIDLGVLDLFFDIDVWTKGGNLLGSVTGSVASDGREYGPTKTQSALAGAFAGAGLAIAAGASITGGTAVAAGGAALATSTAGITAAEVAAATGAAGAAAQGASLGTFSGPVGILAGAAIGGLAGLLMS